MTAITVEGVHRLTQQAEHGVLGIEVALHGSDRDAVVRRHAELHTEVVTELRARGTLALEVGSPWTWSDVLSPGNPDGSVPQHHATSTITATYADLEALAADVAAFALRPELQVQQVRWELSEATREGLLDAARVLAVQDAARRARSYAAAIRPGVHAEPALVSITERQVHGGGGPTPMFARADMGAGIQFTTPEIEVEAAIVAVFEV
ncbi:SIMPL domain-containing protein [Microbacterium stercoris]|uniref:SIMPL domain-containing protein n=1 Tax=Microbacterium stercoris TaxID=2820289 RepID=A0A939TTS3_9MICO|nr:SIMPL domain-containing protein [Microbacterium stercoris]MBO3663284.1 SIMPL domain-containing protein [Microbacterium stercoris]